MADLNDLFTMARELEAGANALIPMARTDDLLALGEALKAVADGYAELSVAMEDAGVNAGEHPELMTALQRVNQVMEELEQFSGQHPGSASLH